MTPMQSVERDDDMRAAFALGALDKRGLGIDYLRRSRCAVWTLSQTGCRLSTISGRWSMRSATYGAWFRSCFAPYVAEELRPGVSARTDQEILEFALREASSGGHTVRSCAWGSRRMR
jgi:hypothetical protein